MDKCMYGSSECWLDGWLSGWMFPKQKAFFLYVFLCLLVSIIPFKNCWTNLAVLFTHCPHFGDKGYLS